MTDFLAPAAVFAKLEAGDKATALRGIAERAAALASVPGTAVLAAVTAREELGSTGVGGGIAVPHARVAGLPRLIGAFARLARPVEFDAVDGRPVDLVFLLLIPEGMGKEHLAALAAMARTLRDGATAERLRLAADSAELHSILAAPMFDAASG